MKFSKTLIYLYVFIGLVPYFEAADKIHPQTFYLAILNSISIGLIINNLGLKKIREVFDKIIQNKQVLFYFGFLFFCLLSFYQSINTTQSMIEFVEKLTQFISLMNLIFLISLQENVIKFFIRTTLILLTIELSSTYFPYFFDIATYGHPINRSLDYRGVTGSVNIISYLILMKLPLIYYLGITQKKFTWISALFVTLSIYAITVIHQTRSAIILTLLVSIFLALVFYYNKNVTNKKEEYKLINFFKVILLPIVITFFLSNYQSYLFKITENVQSRLSSINIEEYSTNSRIRYFSHAIQSIKANPLKGIGIGNWQLESIKYDSQNMQSYIVPYHVHNDFLELAAEIGLIGATLYYLVFLSIFLVILNKIILLIKKKKPIEYEIIFFTIIGIYFIDSMVNFPFGRVLQQINLFFIISVCISYFKNQNFNLIKNLYFKRLKNFVLISIIISIPVTLIYSYKIYISSTHQKIMLSHYNLADYSLSLDDIDNYEMDYSDLTVTTIPMKSLKGFFYMKNGLWRESIDLFNEGTKHNPYLNFSESYKSFSFLNIGEIDSALYFSKKAFEKIPGNVVHFAHYALSLVMIKDSIELKKAYEKTKFRKDLHDEIYLTAMADITNKDQSNFALENFEFNSLSDNDGLKRNYYTLKIGEKEMLTAAQFNELGDFYFKNGDFTSAKNFFKDASELNPFEFPYKENYANSLMQLGDFKLAVEILNELIYENNFSSIKAKYMLALSYLNLDEKSSACILIQEIKDHQLVRSIELQRFCN